MAISFTQYTGGGRISTQLTAGTQGTGRTYSTWYKKDASIVFDDFPRLIDKNDTTETENLIFRNAVLSGETFYFVRAFSISDGKWYPPIEIPDDTNWHHVAVTYDESSDTNIPVFYSDGVDMGTADDTNSTPSGTAVTTTEKFHLGNRGDENRGFPGSMAEAAIWDRILTQGEITALAAGYAPSNFPADLVLYHPLTREPEVELINGVCTTVNTLTAEAHPRIIYPSAQILQFPPAAAAGGFEPQWYRNRSAIIGAGMK